MVSPKAKLTVMYCGFVSKNLAIVLYIIVSITLEKKVNIDIGL